MNLNPEQCEAVTATDGPVAIIAGPGSGKTLVIVERVARLIRDNTINPEYILVVTFTTKATAELRERLRTRLNGALPTVSTFHALALDMLKTHAPRVGLDPSFHIVADPDARRETNALDYDDLLQYAHTLLRDHPDILAGYRQRFRYIMVDEYQDTSAMQTELLDLLAAGHQNICIIGDPDQQIYSFRGAAHGQFAAFARRYPARRTFTLTYNYRSTPEIITAARSCLVSVEHRVCIPVRPPGQRVTRISAPDALAEARHIARTIQMLIGGGDFLDMDSGIATPVAEPLHPGDIAVIYRLHTVGQKLATSLRTAGVPYARIGAKNFFEHPEIRDVLTRLVNIPPTGSLSETLRTLYQTHSLQQRYDDGTPSGPERWDRLLHLLSLATTHDHLEPARAKDAFLADAALARPEDTAPQPHAVVLLSVHAAKGLEFPVVFVAGVEEGLFPYIKMREDATNTEHIAEENRLLYVALTRAKDRLFISHAKQRMLFGNMLNQGPSRFLHAIPEDSFDLVTLKSKIKKLPSPQRSLFG